MNARTPSATPPASEFICPGCGRPLAIALRSQMCFAEAQTCCPGCERDYQEGRGRWANRWDPPPAAAARPRDDAPGATAG